MTGGWWVWSTAGRPGSGVDSRANWVEWRMPMKPDRLSAW